MRTCVLALMVACCLSGTSLEAGLLASSLKVNAYTAVEEVTGLVPTDQCCGQRCITYRKHRAHKRVCCDCGTPAMETILMVKDPCNCCFVEVPVCVPGCCQDAPKMSCKKGLFGRYIVCYEWCCGYQVRVIFTRKGDLIVHTYGK